MAVPAFGQLGDPIFRSWLISLREAVSPLLAGNYLPAFTDHTVDHSDQLCELVDKLASPLSDAAALTDIEAFVLYSAAYLHDVGLQHQRANETQIIQSILIRNEFSGRSWGDLSPTTKQQIVREQHHRISGEMIIASVNAALPILGIQLTDEWHPGQINALVVAHCLDMDGRDQDEYRDLIQDWGSFRTSLLSALLRLADILDESRRRSRLHLEKTRELNLESRMHWWRHYYVAEVAFAPNRRTISLWFDFPPSRREQYRSMIIPLQIPFLEAEFSRQGAVLARHNLMWRFQQEELPATQSTARAMEDDLERFILEKHALERQRQAERDTHLLLEQLSDARPTIERELDKLRCEELSISADSRLSGFRDLARHLAILGGRRAAWTLLSSEFDRLSKSVTLVTKFEVATDLAAMMLEDGQSDHAARLLQPLNDDASMVAPSMRFRFVSTFAEACLDQCDVPTGVAASNLAIELAEDADAAEAITANIDEAKLLQGELCGERANPENQA